MRILALLLGLALPLMAGAQTEGKEAAFKEGVHYTVLADQPKPSGTGKIEVAEMFWYGCGHCYTFEPLIAEWKKTIGEDVNFIRSPAMWRQRANPADAMWTHAKLYYTASSMGLLDKLHMAFFDAMHRQNLRLINPDEIAGLVYQHDLDGKAFVSTMDSFAVNAQVQQADARQRNYRITGTPEMVVGGYYHVSATKAGGQKEMLAVVDHLLEKVRSER